MQSLFSLIQDMYAERLGKAYVLGANWFFWGIYKVMSPFMAERTKQKIVFVDTPADLLKYFDINEVPSEYKDELRKLSSK